MKFFLYTSRRGENTLMDYSPESFGALLMKAERDNGVSMADARRQGFEMDGSFEQGFWWMDDGGEINTIELETL